MNNKIVIFLSLIVLPCVLMAVDVVILNEKYGEKIIQQCTREVPKSIDGTWIVGKNHIIEIKNKLIDVLKLKPKSCCNRKLQKLDDYNFQIVGLIIKGEKKIYLNAVHNIIWNIKDSTKPIIACDGGSMHWGVLYDLKKMHILAHLDHPFWFKLITVSGKR